MWNNLETARARI